MPAFIHQRAEHILARNPAMPKSEAFAIATQQSHALGKSPKGYGTAAGKRDANAKYTTPGDDKKTANPGHLESPKMAAFLGRLIELTKGAAVPMEFGRRFREGAAREFGPAVGMLAGAGIGHALKMNELASSGLGYGVGSLGQLAAEHMLARSKATP